MNTNGYLRPWIFGVIAGGLIVLAEAIFNFYPPSAYAFCLTCHTRDLVNTAANTISGQNFQTSFLAQRVIMVTSPAVFFGAFSAARRFKEFRRQKSSRPSVFFIFGFITMIVGILIFGCPTRIAVRTGYGDLYGIVALIGLMFGIWAGTWAMRRWWRRKGGNL